MICFKNTRFFASVLFLLTFSWILVVPSATAAFRYLHVGMKMPEVVGTDLTTGTEVSSTKLTKDDNIVIVVFWATWSARSIEELEALKSIALEHHDKPIKIIAVNIDNSVLTERSTNNIKQVVSQLDLPYPTIIDKDYKLFNSFGVIAVPSTAITDSSNIIKFGPAGYSLTTKDLILDSLMVLLGIKDVSDSISIRDSYTPKNKSLRYYNLALNLRLQGMYKRALSNLETAIESDSLFAAPFSLRGEIYTLLKQPEKALREYQHAVSLDSQVVAAQAGLGHTLYLTGKTDEAVAVLKNLLIMDDTYTPAIVYLSQCYLEKNSLDEAYQLLENARSLNPKDPSLLYNMGKIHKKKMNYGEAVTAYKNALDILLPEK